MGRGGVWEGGGSRAKETELVESGQEIAVPEPRIVNCWLCVQTLHPAQSLSETNKYMNVFHLP